MAKNRWLIGGIFFIMVIFIYSIIFPIYLYLYFYKYDIFLGGFRYQIHMHNSLEDKYRKIMIEPLIFAYTYKFPFLYVYGISGYTKVNVIPFNNHIEKVINTRYYETISDDEMIYVGSIDVMREEYDQNINIYESFDGVISADRTIFLELQAQGAQKYETGKWVYLKGLKQKNTIIPNLWWKGLDNLNQQLQLIY